MKKYSHLIHTNLTSAGRDDVFLTKHDSSGNLVWVKQAGGANQNIGQDVCADTNGNFYVVGKRAHPGTAPDQDLVCCGARFVPNRSAPENALWVRAFPSAGSHRGDCCELRQLALRRQCQAAP